MKKSILTLSILALILAGCSKSKNVEKAGEESAETKVEKPSETVTYKRPDLGKVLNDGTSPNPLIETELEGVFVVHPHPAQENNIINGEMYAVRIISNETNEVLWVIDQVVSNWQGMSGWGGKVVPEDYTFITADYLQFVVKGDKYTVKPDIPDEYVFGNMDNPLQPSEYEKIFTVKPYYSKYTRELIDLGDTYTAKIIDKKTDEVVLTFDTVVRDWQGMSGWSGRVVAEDFTFITIDCVQYVVKAETYDVIYIQ